MTSRGLVLIIRLITRPLSASAVPAMLLPHLRFASCRLSLSACPSLFHTPHSVSPEGLFVLFGRSLW